MANSVLSISPTFFFFFFYFVFVLMIQAVNCTTFTMKNNCPFSIWPAILSAANSPLLHQTGFQLDAGASSSLPAPPDWSGRIWARTHCSADSSGKFSCMSGDCGSGTVECKGAGGAAPTTLLEFTLNGADGKDFYDVSCVDGFNLPVSVIPQGGGGAAASRCGLTACPVDINGRCPAELQERAADSGAVIGCKSACLAFDTDRDCCRGAFGGPNTCTPSTYSQMFKSACPQAYSYAYDDRTSTFTCIGANYSITFCP